MGSFIRGAFGCSIAWNPYFELKQVRQD